MNPDQTKNTFVLKGVGVSPGVAIGRVYRFDPLDSEISFYKLKSTSLIPKEILRFKKALKESVYQLLEIQKNLKKTKVTEPLYVIDVHILILKDKKFVSRTIKYIQRLKINAEWAVRLTLDRYEQIFEKVEDTYIRGRISDVQYVGQRILSNLSGEKKETIWGTDEKVIVIAQDISPANTVQMKMEKVIGFATDAGGRTSHTAIVARDMELPAVVGLDNVTRFVRTGDEIIVDGISGLVVVNPYPEMLQRYEEKKLLYSAARDEYLKDAKAPAVTSDNYTLQIGCNIEFVEEIPSAIAHGAEHIGLYRTEFYIYKSSGNYRRKKIILIITARLSARKIYFGRQSELLTWAAINFLPSQKPVKELNPQMGLRAIRFCLKEVEIFKTQLRAIWRAGALGKTRILFPMISSVEEIVEAKKLLEETRKELLAQGENIASEMEIGAMIEVPAAVVIADKLAREVDFFSIGTNDLIQYSLAIDRSNERLTYLYEPLHPAVLKLVKSVVDTAHEAGIRVSMCGEMAGDPICTLILLGMELDELSMNHLAIPRIKKIIRESTLKESKLLLEKALSFNMASEVRMFVHDYMKKRFPVEFQNEDD